ncbi:hypothetical protein CHO01_35240 [Cellulomonas hominis]|uniref:Uncharacterized protein n=1 Tax=Cellulomonas hominis TaxID=156981 RepID=A0A511FKN1_9CELL|nr:hypothetical protein [Cellulomonas hominis]MBB5471355.1 hypothetical protein [Cellulomonas hominis]NKY11992.1 hypothetical protein [Cellulomonas hominis]GEL48408.1 hypothetical protein CHO01_35240 [Cellulomonas hominis]
MRTTTRRAAVLALPLCLLVGLTAARVVGTDEVRVDFEGVTFALESAGSGSPGWRPAAADWHASDAAWTLDLASDELAPGGSVDVRVAVRNTSGTDATVVLALADPDPTSPGTDLFGALEAAVREDGALLASGPAGAVRVTLPGAVGPHGSDVRVLDLSLTLPATGDGRWVGARTGVQVLLEGTSR